MFRYVLFSFSLKFKYVYILNMLKMSMSSLIPEVVRRRLFLTGFFVVNIIPKCMRLFLVALHHGEGSFFLHVTDSLEFVGACFKA